MNGINAFFHAGSALAAMFLIYALLKTKRDLRVLRSLLRDKASGVQRVAHIPLDMSLDERDQRLLADEWLMSDQHPDPLPALAVRRIVARRDVGRAQAAASAGWPGQPTMPQSVDNRRLVIR